RKMGVNDFTEKVAKDEPTRFDELIDDKIVTLSYVGAGHIMGTCRMGAKKDNSVVNSDQQSWDHDNLYLVGSSTFPTGATANPTLTIAALSLRTAAKTLRKYLRSRRPKMPRTKEKARQFAVGRKHALAAALGLVALAGTLSITRAAGCPPETQVRVPPAPEGSLNIDK